MNSVRDRLVPLNRNAMACGNSRPNPERNDVRGMSGGPVFRIVEERIARLELVGFIYLFMYEADEDGDPIGDGHTILARHADVIRADGSLAVG